MTDEHLNHESDSYHEVNSANPGKLAKIRALAGTDSYKLWSVVMGTYLFLFLTIGYIAFWEQSFNKPDHIVGPYEDMWEEYLCNTHGNGFCDGNMETRELSESDSSPLTETDSEFRTFLNDMMKDSANNSGDEQELASQSFNIVLGAFLAFLSATATMVFQGKFAGKKKEESE